MSYNKKNNRTKTSVAKSNISKLIKSPKFLATSGLIAALYIILTLLSSIFGLSSGMIQIRFSEAMCVLPAFTPAAIPGLFIGCLLANVITGAIIFDTIFGSLATLLGAIGTYFIALHFSSCRDESPKSDRSHLSNDHHASQARFSITGILASVPPILANTLIIPFILSYAYHLEAGIGFFFITVFIGEAISAGILGQLLYAGLLKHRDIFTK